MCSGILQDSAAAAGGGGDDEGEAGRETPEMCGISAPPSESDQK